MGDLSHQDPILPRHGMQRTANTLGLKVTAESMKNYIKKSCVVEWPVRYKSAVRRELKTEVSWREFLERNKVERASRQKLDVRKE